MIIIILTSIIIGFLVAAIINELAIFVVYGGFVSKKVIEQFMMLDENNVRLNSLDYSIISTSPYISTHSSLFCKYHIHGVGQIPRWSKLHKKIKDMHENLILKELQNNNLFD